MTNRLYYNDNKGYYINNKQYNKAVNLFYQFLPNHQYFECINSTYKENNHKIVNIEFIHKYNSSLQIYVKNEYFNNNQINTLSFSNANHETYTLTLNCLSELKKGKVECTKTTPLDGTIHVPIKEFQKKVLEFSDQLFIIDTCIFNYQIEMDYNKEVQKCTV